MIAVVVGEAIYIIGCFFSERWVVWWDKTTVTFTVLFENWFTKNRTVVIAGIFKDTFINDLMPSNTWKKYVHTPENHNTQQFEEKKKNSVFSGTVKLFFLKRQEVHVKQMLVQCLHWFE